MSVTPAEARKVTFTKPLLGRPGYLEDEVDDVLDLVDAELARLISSRTPSCTSRWRSGISSYLQCCRHHSRP